MQLSKFQTSSFEVRFPRGSLRHYTVRHRPILPLVQDLFEDKLFVDLLTLYPEQRYIQNPNGGLMRIWEENSSGDDWWEIQASSHT